MMGLVCFHPSPGLQNWWVRRKQLLSGTVCLSYIYAYELVSGVSARPWLCVRDRGLPVPASSERCLKTQDILSVASTSTPDHCNYIRRLCPTHNWPRIKIATTKNTLTPLVFQRSTRTLKFKNKFFYYCQCY